MKHLLAGSAPKGFSHGHRCTMCSAGSDARQAFQAEAGAHHPQSRAFCNQLCLLVRSATQAQIHAPAAVRAADLLQQVWPADAPYRPHTSAHLVMSPAGAYTDFRMAGGGAGFWCHLVSGAKTFALCPPTPRNLATYTAWASGARHSAVSCTAGRGCVGWLAWLRMQGLGPQRPSKAARRAVSCVM